MEIKDKIVYHICRHKELGDVLQEGIIFDTKDFSTEQYRSSGKNQKEFLAEKVRMKLYPNLPKRTESMYICLEKDIEKWKKIIGATRWYRIFKLKATGEVFWTDNCEYENDNYEKYWKGCDSDSPEGQIEGLFQGKYQILETIEKRG